MIVPSLWFATEALEAAEFYTSVFPRSEVSSVSRTGDGADAPVMAVHFSLDGQAFTALNGAAETGFTDAVSLTIPCADQAEIDHYWSALTAGGTEVQCGWLKDRYGLAWQVVPANLGDLLGDPDPERAGRAMEAMLSMVKFDIAAIEAAADAT
jgi:predicted 3-demethylubiquinone-9 3-methyltransferase (glyoxalase superfamily)